MNTATLPGVTATIPQPGDTVYVTEVYNSYAPITPIASFMKIPCPQPCTMSRTFSAVQDWMGYVLQHR